MKKTELEVIIGGALLLMLLSRVARANANATYGQNPYAYSNSASGMMAPGMWDANLWDANNATPAYYLGAVPVQSPLTAYLNATTPAAMAAPQSVPIGMF